MVPGGAGQQGANLARGGLQVRKVLILAFGWRAHGNQRKLAARHGLGQVAGGRQPARSLTLAQQFLQARLMERRLAGTNQRHPFRRNVHRAHRVAERRQARARHQADVSGSYHCYDHGVTP